MSKDAQINAIMLKVDGELDPQAKLLMSKFLQSMQEDPMFDKMIDLLERFPSVMGNFAKCFQDKVNFFKNQEKAEWGTILEKEKEIVESIPSEDSEDAEE